jgi:DNA-binding transcriptional LysR family regulator
MDWADRIGRRIKLRDLHILLAVAQSGSIARAAESLAITQPVVSKVISDLEHALGVRLLDRNRRGAEPTLYGRALLRRGMLVFDELRQGVKEIEFLKDPTTGELSIMGPGSVVDGLVPTIIDRLSRQFPRLVFHVTQAPNPTEQFRHLRERNVDLIVRRLPRSIAEEKDLDTEILFDEPLLIAAGTQSPWARRRRVELAELINERWVLPPTDTDVGPYIEEIFRGSGLDVPQASVVCASMHMNHALLATGRFLAIYPGSLLWFSGKRLSVKVLPVKLSVTSTPFGIITLKDRMLSPVAKLFIDCAHQVVGPLTKTNK